MSDETVYYQVCAFRGGQLPVWFNATSARDAGRVLRIVLYTLGGMDAGKSAARALRKRLRALKPGGAPEEIIRTSDFSIEVRVRWVGQSPDLVGDDVDEDVSQEPTVVAPRIAVKRKRQFVSPLEGFV